MSIHQKLAEAARQANGEQNAIIIGLVDEVNANDWVCTINYVDPDKGTNMILYDAPLPNNGGTSSRTSMPKRGDMVAFCLAKGGIGKPFVLAFYTVHDLQVSNNYFTMGDLLGGP